MSPEWFSRYRAGQRDLVWHELRQAGSFVREPGLVEEAQLVCDEMARRARWNIDVILGRLGSAGYRFHAGGDEGEREPVPPHFPPTSAAEEHVCWLDERFGPVPLSLLSWVRIVGDVWLVGTHPDWPGSEDADPLVIKAEGATDPGITEYMEARHATWESSAGTDLDEGPFVLPLSPDRFHKHRVSGGGPYGMLVPDEGAEGIFVTETAIPFVSYLNWVFSCGGFPFPSYWSDDGWRVKRSLAEGLLRL